MPEISIIVPIYNQEKFLSECLGSIAIQTFSDFEAILIDDGSTDGSRLIYEEYVKRDNRFLAFQIANGGVSSARNVGLDHAKGKYVMFVDSDDRLPEDALQNHLNHFSEEVDMTMGSFLTFSDEEAEVYRVEVAKSEIVSREKCLYDFTPNGKGDWQRYLWNRMMRRSVIVDNNLLFNEAIHYKEDGLFLVQYLLRCKGQVAYMKENVYCYRINPSGAMNGLDNSFSPRVLTDLDAHILILKEMKKHNAAKETIDRAMNHAFGTRIWILNKMKAKEVPYRSFQIISLLRLYWNTGFIRTARHLYSHFRRAIAS